MLNQKMQGTLKVSRSGESKISFRGHEYNYGDSWKLENGEKQYLWRCKKHGDTQCGGSLLTDKYGNVLPEGATDHSHSSINAAKLLRALRRLRTSHQSTNDESRNVSPKPERCGLTAKEVNQQDERKPTFPNALQPYEVCVDDENCVILTTPSNLELLSLCDTWFADGTSRVPPQFSKMLTIYGKPNENMQPLVYVLLSQPSVNVYEACLQNLVAISEGELDITLQPSVFYTDLDQAATAAFQAVFDFGLSIKACHFHLSRFVWRSITATGLKRLCRQDEHLAVKLRMLPALAFAPISELKRLFDCVAQEVGDEARKVTDQFGRTFIYGQFVRDKPTATPMREPATYEPHVWNNGFDEQLAIINDSLAAWHHHFKHLTLDDKPEFSLFVDKLQQEQKTTLEMKRTENDDCPKRKRVKVARQTEKLLSVVRNLNAPYDIDYLRTIANNYTFSCL